MRPPTASPTRSAWLPEGGTLGTPVLTGAVEAQVVVIGGGLTGTLCAWELLQAGVPAERLVVAHTVQHELGVNAACDGRVWRVDVGLSAYYGGEPQALEIIGDEAQPIGRP